MTIRVTDLTDTNDTLNNTITMPIELSSYSDDGTIEFAAGRSEEVGGSLYVVEGGNHTITDSGLADGLVYVLLLDNGDGTASAYLSTKSGSWDPNLGGYYISDASADDGAKVLFKMRKDTTSGTVYKNKVRQYRDEIEIARQTFDNLNDRITAWSILF